MGGIMPVTRKLLLSILGHILSAVFISIEIMSIIDTMNTPHGTMAHKNGSMNKTTFHLHDSIDMAPTSTSRRLGPFDFGTVINQKCIEPHSNIDHHDEIDFQVKLYLLIPSKLLL